MSSLRAKAPQWVAGLLVIALGAQAAFIATGLGGADARFAVPTPSASVDGLPAARRTDISTLVSANLFGQSSAPAATDGNAPVTSMALVLVGVLAGDDPRQGGLAIVGPSAAGAKVYVIGSTLPGGAKLHSVFGDRVLLDRGGTVEALMLPRQRSSPGVTNVPMTPPPMVSVNRVQQLVQENPGLVGDIIRPQAVLADGRQRGYRVYPGPNSQAFTRLGLRAGDMVTAINGTALDDPARGAEIFGTLGSASEARVTVMRNGRQQDLVLNLAQVAAEAERASSESAQSAAGGITAPPPAMGQPATAQ